MHRHTFRHPRLAAFGAGIAAAIALGMLVRAGPAWRVADAPAAAPSSAAAPKSRMASTAGSTRSGRAADMGAALDLFQQFALNALLAPLIDDNDPPRWTRTDLIECEAGTQLRIDGHALEPGTVLPAVPFHVQWRMKACHAIDDGNALDGVVDMQVFHDDEELTAVVDAHLLEVVSQDGRRQAMQPAVFGARLGLLAPPSP